MIPKGFYFIKYVIKFYECIHLMFVFYQCSNINSNLCKSLCGKTCPSLFFWLISHRGEGTLGPSYSPIWVALYISREQKEIYICWVMMTWWHARWRCLSAGFRSSSQNRQWRPRSFGGLGKSRRFQILKLAGGGAMLPNHDFSYQPRCSLLSHTM